MPDDIPAWRGHVPRLPLEIWDQILHRHIDFTRDELQNLCHVGRTFKELCQASLFRVLSVSPKVLMSYNDLRNLINSPIHLYTSAQRLERLQEIRGSHISAFTGGTTSRRPREKWEEDMLRLVESTDRLSIVGDHKFLCRLPRCLRVHGYDISVGGQGTWERFDPFQPPSQQATRLVYDALVRLRATLAQSLRRFGGLKRLELYGCPIDRILLEAISLHPQIRELVLDRCWFLSPPTPLASIPSISIQNIPTKHLTHAYRLIPPACITSLEVFSCGGVGSELAFEELCTRVVGSSKAKLSQLQGLSLHFRSENSNHAACLRKFLAWTPVLRRLVIKGQHSREVEGTLPISHIPDLQIISGSLQLLQAIVPGRPVESLSVDTGNCSGRQGFVAADERELNALLQPLTLSTATITSLVLSSRSGHHLAPVWQLIPCVTSLFPELRQLQCTVTGARRYRWSTHRETMLRLSPRDSSMTPLSLLGIRFPVTDGHVHPHIEPECLEVRLSIWYHPYASPDSFLPC